MYRFYLCLALLFISLLSFPQNRLYKEPLRPQFHFSPPIHWTNDPNGLVYYNGSYHLFYQYNPMGIRWGHMSWGHAISKDLVHWENLPIAIPEEKNVMIFSGTCVVDINNTSGFGKNGKVPLVAVYTGHVEGVNQSQHIAYSLDEGMTWTKYDKNPVLDLNKKDFRDPKIFWHEEKKYWVMALMLSDVHIMQLYSSQNLKDWNHLSNFGPVGDTSGVWECPDLTEVPVEGEPGKKKWVLQMSLNGSMQYFVGGFDGINFINESSPGKILRPDQGPDYYAAIAYNQLPSSIKPTAIGWVNNWNYANDIPTSPWRGAMSIPRTLSVKRVNGEWMLIQRPIDALKSLRSGPAYELKNVTLSNTRTLPVKSTQFEMHFTFMPSKNSVSGVRLAVGTNKYLELGYDDVTQTFYVDRTNASKDDLYETFTKRNRYEVKVPLKKAEINVQLYFDNSIIEAFVNDGEAVMTLQIFPDAANNDIGLFSRGGQTIIKKLSLWKINSSW